MGRSSVAAKKNQAKIHSFWGGRRSRRKTSRKRSQISRPTQEKVFQARQSKKEKGGKDGGISGDGGSKKSAFFSSPLLRETRVCARFFPCDASLISLQETRFFWWWGEEKEVPEKRWENVWERGKELQNRTRKMQVSCGKYAH